MISKLIEKDNLFKGIFSAYFILFGHVLLLAGIGVTIILFKGMYQYLPWVLGAIAALIGLVIWVGYKKFKQQAPQIKDILQQPEFKDREIDIKLLGGIASFKIEPGSQQHSHQLEHFQSHSSGTPLMIEQDLHQTEQKLVKLNTLFEKDLITREEFEKAKQEIIQG